MPAPAVYVPYYLILKVIRLAVYSRNGLIMKTPDGLAAWISTGIITGI
jgi:hypothetical protein